MKYYYCENCEAFFSEDELDSRASVLEDGVSPWEHIAICPSCKEADQLFEASVCERCGEPVRDGEHLCVGCSDDLYAILDRSVLEVGGEYTRAKDILLDFIERTWC